MFAGIMLIMEHIEEMCFSMMPFTYFRSQAHCYSVWQANILLSVLITPQRISIIDYAKIYKY